MHAPAVPEWYRALPVEVGTCVVTEFGALLVTVPIGKLVEMFDPLDADPWLVGGVQREQIETALHAGRLRSENPCWRKWYTIPVARAEDEWDSAAHAERIAWLVRHGWDISEAFQLEIDEYGGVSLKDGNHRLHALAFLNIDGSVNVELSGFIDFAEDLLGIRVP